MTFLFENVIGEVLLYENLIADSFFFVRKGALLIRKVDFLHENVIVILDNLSIRTDYD